MAKIQLNGDHYEIKFGTNLNRLLKNLKISTNKVAVEVNGIIAEKNSYERKIINEGDKIEIVHFIGGG